MIHFNQIVQLLHYLDSTDSVSFLCKIVLFGLCPSCKITKLYNFESWILLSLSGKERRGQKPNLLVPCGWASLRPGLSWNESSGNKEWEGVYFINISQGRDQWQTHMNMIMNLTVPWKTYISWLTEWQLASGGGLYFVSYIPVHMGHSTSKYFKISLSLYFVHTWPL